ncbi:MAG: hypothetical protein OXH76_20835 [Boseongicola sp.]|nr:hypothetical protein [Boseongicola sp.]
MDESQLTEANWTAINRASERMTGVADVRSAFKPCEPDSDPGSQDLATEFFTLENRDAPMTSLSFTQQTVADLDDARMNRWHESGERQEDGNAVYYQAARTARGNPPFDMALIDCGGFRAIIQTIGLAECIATAPDGAGA